MVLRQNPNLKYTAFIGTRDLNLVPHEGIDMFRRAAQLAAEKGRILKTGAAIGADQLAAETYLASGGRGVRLYVPSWGQRPWGKYEADWIQDVYGRYPGKVRVDFFDPAANPAAVEAVNWHPRVEKLSSGGRDLMARNYEIVDGANSVIAIPKPPEGGGTGHGIEIARRLGIPLYNLSMPDGRDQFGQLVGWSSGPKIFDMKPSATQGVRVANLNTPETAIHPDAPYGELRKWVEPSLKETWSPQSQGVQLNYPGLRQEYGALANQLINVWAPEHGNYYPRLAYTEMPASEITVGSNPFSLRPEAYQKKHTDWNRALELADLAIGNYKINNQNMERNPWTGPRVSNLNELNQVLELATRSGNYFQDRRGIKVVPLSGLSAEDLNAAPDVASAFLNDLHGNKLYTTEVAQTQSKSGKPTSPFLRFKGTSLVQRDPFPVSIFGDSRITAPAYRVDWASGLPGPNYKPGNYGGNLGAGDAANPRYPESIVSFLNERNAFNVNRGGENPNSVVANAIARWPSLQTSVVLPENLRQLTNDQLRHKPAGGLYANLDYIKDQMELGMSGSKFRVPDAETVMFGRDGQLVSTDEGVTPEIPGYFHQTWDGEQIPVKPGGYTTIRRNGQNIRVATTPYRWVTDNSEILREKGFAGENSQSAIERNRGVDLFDPDSRIIGQDVNDVDPSYYALSEQLLGSRARTMLSRMDEDEIISHLDAAGKYGPVIYDHTANLAGLKGPVISGKDYSNKPIWDGAAGIPNASGEPVWAGGQYQPISPVRNQKIAWLGQQYAIDPLFGDLARRAMRGEQLPMGLQVRKVNPETGWPLERNVVIQPNLVQPTVDGYEANPLYLPENARKPRDSNYSGDAYRLASIFGYDLKAPRPNREAIPVADAIYRMRNVVGSREVNLFPEPPTTGELPVDTRSLRPVRPGSYTMIPQETYQDRIWSADMDRRTRMNPDIDLFRIKPHPDPGAPPMTMSQINDLIKAKGKDKLQSYAELDKYLHGGEDIRTGRYLPGHPEDFRQVKALMGLIKKGELPNFTLPQMSVPVDAKFYGLQESTPVDPSAFMQKYHTIIPSSLDQNSVIETDWLPGDALMLKDQINLMARQAKAGYKFNQTPQRRRVAQLYKGMANYANKQYDKAFHEQFQVWGSSDIPNSPDMDTRNVKVNLNLPYGNAEADGKLDWMEQQLNRMELPFRKVPRIDGTVDYEIDHPMDLRQMQNLNDMFKVAGASRRVLLLPKGMSIGNDADSGAFYKAHQNLALGNAVMRGVEWDRTGQMRDDFVTQPGHRAIVNRAPMYWDGELITSVSDPEILRQMIPEGQHAPLPKIVNYDEYLNMFSGRLAPTKGGTRRMVKAQERESNASAGVEGIAYDPIMQFQDPELNLLAQQWDFESKLRQIKSMVNPTANQGVQLVNLNQQPAPALPDAAVPFAGQTRDQFIEQTSGGYAPGRQALSSEPYQYTDSNNNTWLIRPGQNPLLIEPADYKATRQQRVLQLVQQLRANQGGNPYQEYLF